MPLHPRGPRGALLIRASQTLYGMNLFDFDDSSRNLNVSPKLWLYFATWLPLTLVTFVGYRMMKKEHDRRDKGVPGLLGNFSYELQKMGNRVKHVHPLRGKPPLSVSTV